MRIFPARPWACRRIGCCAAAFVLLHAAPAAAQMLPSVSDNPSVDPSAAAGAPNDGSAGANASRVVEGSFTGVGGEVPDINRQQALSHDGIPVQPPLHEIPDVSGPIGSKAWWDGPYATGDWGGFRPKMQQDYGVNLGGSYLSNLAGNPTGGARQGFTNTGSTGLNLNFDLETILGWKDVEFYSTAVWRYGESLTLQYIKNQFNVQQNFGGQNMRLYSAYLQKTWDDDRLLVKLGRLGAGDDFLSTPIYWLYMNNGIDGNPVSVFLNVPFTAYPNATWGAFAKFKPAPEWYVQAGVYEAQTPYQTRMAAHGVDLSFTTGRGVDLNLQAGYTPNTEPDAKGLPGHYSVGTFIVFADFQLLSTPAQSIQNNYGVYVMVDQMVYREGGPGSQQGLTPWFAFIASPMEGRSYMPYYAVGGAIYQGLIPGRDNDIAALGVIYGKFSGDIPASPPRNSYEMILEANYKIQINEWFFVQPDVQYIINTGGGAHPDALVLGAQIGVTF